VTGLAAIKIIELSSHCPKT